MTFDGSIHLGDLLIAVSVLGGGAAFLIRWGGAMQKINGTFALIEQTLNQHEKRLDGHDRQMERRISPREV